MGWMVEKLFFRDQERARILSKDGCPPLGRGLIGPKNLYSLAYLISPN